MAKRQAECHPDRPHIAKGLCQSCYTTTWRQQNPERYAGWASQTKRAECHPDRPVRARGLCNTCYRREWRSDPEHRERERAYQREHQRRRLAALDGRGRLCRVLRKYGLTFDNYSRLVIAQSGRCAACEIATPDLEVDHCHERGLRHVRGLLCHNCNSALGHAKDDIDRLQALIGYLRAVG